MVKVQETNKGQYFITLSKGEVNALGWKKGNMVNLSVVDEGILLKNLTLRKKKGEKN